MAHVDGVDFYVCPTGDAGDRDVRFTTDLDVESYFGGSVLCLHLSRIFGLFSFLVVLRCARAIPCCVRVHYTRGGGG